MCTLTITLVKRCFVWCRWLSNRLMFAGLPRAVWLSLTLCLSVCAMLSKEQGITISAICLVYDFFVVQQVRIITQKPEETCKAGV